MYMCESIFIVWNEEFYSLKNRFHIQHRLRFQLKYYHLLILRLFYTNTDTRFSMSNYLILEEEYIFDVT